MYPLKLVWMDVLFRLPSRYIYPDELIRGLARRFQKQKLEIVNVCEYGEHIYIHLKKAGGKEHIFLEVLIPEAPDPNHHFKGWKLRTIRNSVLLPYEVLKKFGFDGIVSPAVAEAAA